MKVTFFYYMHTKELYAYSGEKDLIRGFEESRDMGKFYKKQCELEDVDLFNLFEEDQNCNQLLLYHFFQSTGEIVIPITMNEKNAIEHIANQMFLIDRYVIASKIPVEIFSKEMQKILFDIEYTKCRDWYLNGKEFDSILQPNMLMIFLENFGNTMKK